MYLKRYHDVQISDSGVWRILKRLGMNRLPGSQRYKPRDRRWKRHEKQLPGHHVQIDVKFIAPLTPAAAAASGTAAPASPGPAARAARRTKYYQYTAIDYCTRLRVLRIYDRNNQKTAIQFADYVIARLPFQVQTIQTDDGAEFQSSFHWHLLDRGIQHRYIKPATHSSTARRSGRTVSTPRSSTGCWPPS